METRGYDEAGRYGHRVRLARSGRHELGALAAGDLRRWQEAVLRTAGRYRRWRQSSGRRPAVSGRGDCAHEKLLPDNRVTAPAPGRPEQAGDAEDVSGAARHGREA